VTSFRRVLVALTSLVVAVLGAAAMSPAAHADDDTTSWTVRPALSQYGSDRSVYGYTANPGQEIADGIDIANQGSKPITLDLYAADGFTTDVGGFDILTPDKESKEIGAWVQPSVKSVTVPAGQEVQIPFSLVIPANATPGDHMGGIVTVLDQRSSGDNGDNGTVIHQRVGLRIKVRVSGAVTPELKVDDVELDFDGGKNPFGTGNATLSYTVRNTGNVILGGTQSVKVAGAFGASSRTVELDRLPELLPGDTWTAEVPVDKVHALLWISGELTVTPVITDAAGSTSTLDPITVSARVTASAWSWVVMVGFVVGMVGLGWLLVFGARRWRRAAKARTEAKVAAAVEEALEEMASSKR
jgi:uncharacterized membrane protein